ncbi:MAG: cation:proton antiporter subunit C [Desulfurococcaceae archaeon]
MISSQEQLLSLMMIVVLVTIIFNIGIALYGVFAKHSLIKKLMALVIFSDSVNILAVALGFRALVQTAPSPPVMTDIPRSLEDIEVFTYMSVDPLPQAFVITAIVIGLSIIVFMLTLIIRYYEHYKTLDLTTILEKDEIHEEDII